MCWLGLVLDEAQGLLSSHWLVAEFSFLWCRTGLSLPRSCLSFPATYSLYTLQHGSLCLPGQQGYLIPVSYYGILYNKAFRERTILSSLHIQCGEIKGVCTSGCMKPGGHLRILPMTPSPQSSSSRSRSRLWFLSHVLVSQVPAQLPSLLLLDIIIS